MFVLPDLFIAKEKQKQQKINLIVDSFLI